jgi:hypothetical protein
MATSEKEPNAMIQRHRPISTDLVYAARVCACPNCKRMVRQAADELLASLAFDLAEQHLQDAPALTAFAQQQPYAPRVLDPKP